MVMTFQFSLCSGIHLVQELWIFTSYVPMQRPYLSDPNYNIILDNLQSLTGILYSIAYFCAFETRSGARTTADGAENAEYQN